MTRRLPIAIAVVLAVALAAAAVDPGTPRAFLRFDTNDDGKISRNEFRGPARAFTQLDRDGDGVITVEEFRARPERRVQLPEGTEVVKDVVFGKGGDVELKMDIYKPKAAPVKPMPVIVFIHGGGWRSGDKATSAQRAPAVLEAGFVFAGINYRLTGIATFPAQIHDCKCAIRYLRAHAKQYGIDPNRIGVWGSSAGGHLVALLGTSGGAKELEGDGGWAEQSSRVQAVCDWYGPSDLVNLAKHRGRSRHIDAESILLGGAAKDKLELARQASPITYVTADDPPFLIMQGTEDPVVPAAQSEVLHKALTAVGVDSTYIPLEGAGHGGPQFAKRLPDVLAFFTRTLMAD